jgi:uncharacterized protein YndB with AHSA1/START domain
MATKTAKTTDREISISRILNAPRELVWKVWTDPKHVSEWWGPNGFTTTTKEMDLRPGGKWLHTMHGFGKDFPIEFNFTEVVKPERIVYTNTAPKFTATVTFEEQDGVTKLTMIMVFESLEEYNFVVKEHGAIEGQVQTINRLEEFIAKTQEGKEFTISRVFNAPKELVYKAFSEAEALAQWWGPKGSEIHVSKLDFNPGGIFHYSMKSPMGEMWGLFKYLEMVKPERVVFINCFSDKDQNVIPMPYFPVWPLEVLNILTLTEHEGKTILTLRGGPINATEAEHKAFIEMNKNMEQGFAGTFAQLEEYLTKVSK